MQDKYLPLFKQAFSIKYNKTFDIGLINNIFEPYLFNKVVILI